MQEQLRPHQIKELIDAVEIAIFVIDVSEKGEFIFNSLNTAHEELTGLDSEWIKGKRPVDLSHNISPAGVDAILVHYSECVQKRESVFYEEMIPFNGVETWWKTRLTPLLDEKGNVYRIIGSSSSILENKKNKLELQKNQEILQAVSSMAQVGGWEINLTDNTVIWSDEIYKIHEVEKNFKPSLEEAINFYTEESLPLINQAVQTSIEHGTPFDLKLQIRTAKGNLKWVHAIGKTIFSAGQADRVFGIFQDITHQFNLEETLRRRENSLEEAQKIAHLGTYDYQYPLGEIYWSVEMYRLLNYNIADAPPLFENFSKLIYTEDQSRFKEIVTKAIQNKSAYDIVYRIRKKSGKIRHLHNTGKVLTNSKGEVDRIIGTIIDITERKLIADELQVLSTAVEQNSDSIVITDTTGKILYGNPKFYQLTGYSSHEAIGNNPRILKSGHQNDDFYTDLWNTISNGEVWKGEFLNKKKNGDLYWEDATISPIRNSEGIIIRYVAIKRDITELREAREQLRELATKDSLTGALNRRAGLIVLEKQMHLSWRNRKPLCVSYIDINDLKSVNDSLGHQEGDFLIKSIAELLFANIRVSDSICRMGGDEFMIILPECDLENALLLNERMQKIVSECSKLHKKDYECGFSYGVAEYPADDKMKPEELVFQADQNMYIQKKNSKKK